MIEVEHLTKVYNGRKAVDDISFRVEKGEIPGFLGPNGAGKTTTMRILTCYMPATEGAARVAGYDVFEESLGQEADQARTMLSHAFVGSGPQLVSPTGIAWDEETQRALVVDGYLHALVAIDAVTGERVIVSR